MSKRTKISLAAGAAFLSTAAGAALLSTGAFAMQQNIVDPPVPYEDVPDAAINTGDVPAGVSWQAERRTGVATPPAPALERGPTVGPAAPAAQSEPEDQAIIATPDEAAPQAAAVQYADRNHAGPTRRAPSSRAIVHRTAPQMRHHQGGNWQSGNWQGGNWHGGGWQGGAHGGWSQHGGGWSHGGSHMGGHRWQRVGRGWRMQPYWWSPRFRLHDWRMYGFPEPRNDWFWIRYYDDALLVDRYGMVHDGRWGVDWDRYGERWDRDQFGVPYYQGYEGDFEGPDGVAAAYGYGAPMIITETITTTTTGGYGDRHAARHRDMECDCDGPPPPPPPAPPPPPPPPPVGERG
jgi:Ni/Co efflux regulator RcnB